MTPGSILWLRRDLRLADHPALAAAAGAGWVLPVLLVDADIAGWGAAPRWRMAQAAAALDADLRARGSRLVTAHGEAAEVLPRLAARTGAAAVHAAAGAPDLPGLTVHRHAPNALVPRGTVLTKTGAPFKVFTPFFRALRQHPIAEPLPPPSRIAPPPVWPESEGLDRLSAGMDRGGPVVARFTRPGEAAALARLDTFLGQALAGYATDRNRMGLTAATSGLSDALAVGEIGARTIWHRAMAALQAGAQGAETFLSELAWREFARELHHHWPAIDRAEWAPGAAGFPWRPDGPDAQAWRQGLTGIDLVDAGMREVYATGRMHNRVRMVTASFLTKHLLTDWRVGLAWFADVLTDWDAASNAMNWQWVAGSGPDAAPYFRVFNPDAQAEQYDPGATYRRHWLAGEGDAAFRAAIPRSWTIPAARPAPVVALAAGRARALDAYAAHRAGGVG